MQKRALVCGSIGLDTVFQIHGVIQNEISIKNGKLGRQNLMFIAKNKSMLFGGTGSNIAYGLGLLDTKPLLFSVAGKDFKGEFEKHLRSHGVDLRVFVDPKGYTATFYGMSDEKTQQIGVWQPNAYYDHIEKVSLSNLGKKSDFLSVAVGIFSAGTPQSIYKHMKEARKLAPKEAVLIFDPGQIMSALYGKEILFKTLKIADMVIGNDVEIAQMKKFYDLGIHDIFVLGVKTIIETKGKDGSVIHTREGISRIPSYKPKKIVEATGAGDAYRAGLIYGMLKDLPLEKSAKIGAYLATKNIESTGAQNYKATLSKIKKLF